MDPIDLPYNLSLVISIFILLYIFSSFLNLFFHNHELSSIIVSQFNISHSTLLQYRVSSELL